jgi:signal transduction histidine kinase/ActR/RegA family two-component response regulator
MRLRLRDLKARIAELELRNSRTWLRAELEFMTRLQRLGSLFLKDGNLEPVLGEIVEAAIAVSGADFGDVQILDARTSTLRIVASRGFPEWWLAFWNTVREGHGTCGNALERGERVIVENVERSPIFAGTDALEVQRKAGVRAVQSTPLLTREGKPLGIFSTHWRKPGVPGDRTLRLLDLLARQAADIIERAHTEEALRAANAELVEADRRKDVFLAVLSHELRNPLSSIRNSLFVLDRAPPGGEHSRHAQAVIGRQVGHLARLLDDLLDVTRMARGKIRLQRGRIDLCEMVRRTVEDLGDLFARGDVHLSLTLPEEPLWIDGDRTRVAQVIGNLLGNCAKFTPAGGAAWVAAERSPEGGEAVLRVRDTGIGIAAELLPAVFQAFTQADTSLDRSRGGLGLGLTMVKALAELHGGTASASSGGLGKGSEFTVRLPLAREETAEEARAPREAGTAAARRILVIEDNLDAAESLRAVLALGHHTVEVASSGPEGIEKARAFRPDVILCDIGLPGMDGYEVARAARKDPQLRGTRLVALTGYAAPADVARSADAGFDVHLAKPPSPEALDAALAAPPHSAPRRG